MIMCYFEQTQYLACGHNVETITERCELGEKYRTSMHDKIITALHSNDGQCEKCNPPPAYNKEPNGVTSDLPNTIPSANKRPRVNEDIIDFTDESATREKRPTLDRRDSKGADLMDVS
jgi:hypothetical protein